MSVMDENLERSNDVHDPEVHDALIAACGEELEPMTWRAVLYGFSNPLVEDAYQAAQTYLRLIGIGICSAGSLFSGAFRTARVVSGTNAYVDDTEWFTITVMYYTGGSVLAIGVAIMIYRRQRCIIHFLVSFIWAVSTLVAILFAYTYTYQEPKTIRDAVRNCIWLTTTICTQPAIVCILFKFSFLKSAASAFVLGVVLTTIPYIELYECVVLAMVYWVFGIPLLWAIVYSHRAEFMSQLQCMRLQADAHHKESMQSAAQYEQQLMQEQLERLKSQVKSFLGNDEPLAPLAKVQRKAMVTEAWNKHTRQAEIVEEKGCSNFAIDNMPHTPCVAVSTKDGTHFTITSFLEGTSNVSSASSADPPLSRRANQTEVLSTGSHAFVKIAGEVDLRVSLFAYGFGKAAGHQQLANQEPVLYAGEIELDENQLLVRWNNTSGTYKCNDDMAYQAELPLDKFYAVVQDTETLDRIGAMVAGASMPDSVGPMFLQVPDEGIWLQKVLSQSDESFHSTQAEWECHIKALVDDNIVARHCQKRLMAMVSERSTAVEKYGYGFEVQPIY